MLIKAIPYTVATLLSLFAGVGVGLAQDTYEDLAAEYSKAASSPNAPIPSPQMTIEEPAEADNSSAGPLPTSGSALKALEKEEIIQSNRELGRELREQLR